MILKNYIFILLSGFCGISLSQYSAEEMRLIDSLKTVANNPEAADSARLQALINWDNIIYAYDTDLDVELNQRIIKISEEGMAKPGINGRQMEQYLRAKGMACNNMGLVFVDYGNYKEGLLNFQTSLQIAEYFKDSVKQGNALNNMGMIYKHLKMPDKAMEFYDKSIIFSSDAYSLGTYYNNIGICHFDLGNPDLALECYRKSLIYADSVDDFSGKGNTLANIGLVFFKLDQFDSAIVYLNSAIETYKKIEASGGLAFATKNIGDCYYELGDYKKSLEFCERGLALATEAKSVLAQKESCDCLYRTHKKLGNINEALRYHELYISYRDSVQSISKNEEVLKLDFQFNLDKQRLQDSLEYANQRQVENLIYETNIHKKEKVQYILFAGIGVLCLLGLIMYRSYILKKRDAEIIAQQKLEVETQKHIVEEKNKEITDSINYAKRIQEAILPGDSIFKKLLPNSFIIYKPKDIVAGDFYWIESCTKTTESEDLVLFAVADCTGHGVPGAMVSVVCHNALNRAVNEFKLTDPGKILDKTRELVVETFDNESTVNQHTGTIRDGMDISLCVLNKTTRQINFAGANNSLFIVRGTELIEIKADKQPIGKYAEEKPFSSTPIALEKGDILYLYTDGYADQFGGPDGKKFKYKQLKELLLKNSKLALSEQSNVLNKSFEDWKGNLEQVDDVCLMGVLI